MKKTVLITGSASRLGKFMAIHLAKQGWHIIAHYYSSHEQAFLTREEILNYSSCQLIQANLLEDDLESFWKKLESPPLLLINNASLFLPDHFQEPLHQKKHQKIHFEVPQKLTQLFAQNPQAEQVVNILDSRIKQIDLDYYSYSLSKKALRDLTLASALELAPSIRVNGICPGPILPPPGKDHKYLEEVSLNTPLKRPGHPLQIAQALDYLIGNSYTTGELLYVDGGNHLC